MGFIDVSDLFLDIGVNVKLDLIESGSLLEDRRGGLISLTLDVVSHISSIW